MKAACCWWIVRHAPVPGAKGHINGWSDVDADVSSVSPRSILPAKPKAVVVSHLKRTSQTAMALGYAPTHIETDLAEQNFGAWQGKSWDEIAGPEGRAFWSDFARNAPPGGESFVQQIERTARALERLSDEIGNGDIVAVLHGGTIRAALAHALSLDPLKAQAFEIENLGLTRLDRTTHGWRIGCVNERLFP
ncbi:Phosphoglycerate/bisphosphoglycerate mutase [Rhodospirillaceae bacterium LM-1]|nr:Phosphoglycerate/bisphosphoglycerate mutase [Rhodospirillaceae bacterium LM-1]